jgi:hypothetical protein
LYAGSPLTVSDTIVTDSGSIPLAIGAVTFARCHLGASAFRQSNVDVRMTDCLTVSRGLEVASGCRPRALALAENESASLEIQQSAQFTPSVSFQPSEPLPRTASLSPTFNSTAWNGEGKLLPGVVPAVVIGIVPIVLAAIGISAMICYYRWQPSTQVASESEPGARQELTLGLI